MYAFASVYMIKLFDKIFSKFKVWALNMETCWAHMKERVRLKISQKRSAYLSPIGSYPNFQINIWKEGYTSRKRRKYAWESNRRFAFSQKFYNKIKLLIVASRTSLLTIFLYLLLIKNPDQSEITNQKDGKVIQPHLRGYFKISRHYKWALEQVFMTNSFESVIITEDDLNIADDFFEYFDAMHKILEVDSSLFCVSAWNDNGKRNLIDTSKNGEKLAIVSL